MAPDDRDPWIEEAFAIDFDAADFGVADAAELPDALEHLADIAIGDRRFDERRDEWMQWLRDTMEFDPCLLLGLEQSCDAGVLLPWDMRGVRLWSLPDHTLGKLHDFWRNCPEHVCAYLCVWAYWLVRSERARRRQTLEWSPRSPLPPEKIEHAFSGRAS